MTAPRIVGLVAAVGACAALSQVQMTLPLLLVLLLLTWALGASGALVMVLLRGHGGVSVAIVVRRAGAP